MTERKVKTVKAKKVRTGDFIPGLDNAYVPIDPEPAEDRAWVIDILFHDANGEEGHLLCDPDMPVTVERERKEKKDRQAWFLNEDGAPYPYSVAKQAEDFPNDFHTPYDTEAEAQEAAEQLPKAMVIT